MHIIIAEKENASMINMFEESVNVNLKNNLQCSFIAELRIGNYDDNSIHIIPKVVLRRIEELDRFSFNNWMMEPNHRSRKQQQSKKERKRCVNRTRDKQTDIRMLQGHNKVVCARWRQRLCISEIKYSTQINKQCEFWQKNSIVMLGNNAEFNKKPDNGHARDPQKLLLTNLWKSLNHLLKANGPST